MTHIIKTAQCGAMLAVAALIMVMHPGSAAAIVSYGGYTISYGYSAPPVDEVIYGGEDSCSVDSNTTLLRANKKRSSCRDCKKKCADIVRKGRRKCNGEHAVNSTGHEKCMDPYEKKAETCRDKCKTDAGKDDGGLTYAECRKKKAAAYRKCRRQGNSHKFCKASAANACKSSNSDNNKTK